MSQGLTAQEARHRLGIHGRNELPVIRQRSPLAILFDQFSGIISLLLVGAVAVSIARGHTAEAIAIASVLVLNAAIGFGVEMRSRTALAALQHHIVPHARVIRDDHVIDIDARDVVPGDLLVLESGDGVTADARLASATELQVAEAALTGESMPVSKDASWDGPAETPLADRRNMVYAGTIVLRGHAHANVLATGANTEIGTIGRLTGAVQEQRSPLERRVDALGHRLIIITLGIIAVLTVANVARGVPFARTLDIALALAVAVIPEGLPAVVTVTLALGMQRMARRNALMRRMHAVESLGSTTIVCADKTGTLTTGSVTLTTAFVDGQDVDPAHAASVVRSALLAGGSLQSADAIDVAIADTAERLDLAGDQNVAFDIPFSSSRRYSASFRRNVDGSLSAYAKGAPQQILAMCGGLDDDARAVIAANDRMAASGTRIIAVADGPVVTAAEGALTNLTFRGLLGFRDPPARGVREAIHALREAGIRTVMITGDQKLTAEAIAAEIGDIDQVFSRVHPEEKLRIVERYQKQGEIVAMFGDGVNDAAALRRADVGVAMGGRGTDVAKEAAAVVLQDDSFATIVAAVREGRVIFDNIGKFVFYLFSCNLAELLVILGAAMAGLPLPLLPLQILWLNLVTDTFPALALAVEPAGENVMSRPPRKASEGLVSRVMARRIVVFSVLIALVTMAAFVWALRTQTAESATTIAFVVLGLAQILHLGNARSDLPVTSRIAMRSNTTALAAAAFSAACLAIAIYFRPLADVLGTRAMTAKELLVVVGIAAVPAVIGQLAALRRVLRARPSADR